MKELEKISTENEAVKVLDERVKKAVAFINEEKERNFDNALEEFHYVTKFMFDISKKFRMDISKYHKQVHRLIPVDY